MEAYQSIWYLIFLTYIAIQAIVLWIIFGPSHPSCGITVVSATFALGPTIATPIMHRVPMQWFRVPVGEGVIHSIVGVKIFGWVLDASGWNRVVAKPMRRFSSNKAGLATLEQSLRGNVSAHGTCFIIHVLLTVLALFSEHPLNAALWTLCPGILAHLYPVLLQRSIMLRLYPLLDLVEKQPDKGSNNTLSEQK